MQDINIIFCRKLLELVHVDVRKHYLTVKCENIGVRKLLQLAWVWKDGRDCWEFHGPGNYYWHGRADNAYDARAKGWNAWLEHQKRPIC